MKANILECPIEGLTYTERITDTHTYYTLEPKEGYKMCIKAMEGVNEDGTVEPFYCRNIAVPAPYDFEKNEMGIVAE